MSQSLFNSVGLLVVASIIAAFWTWFWRFRSTTIARLERARYDEMLKADKLAVEHRELVSKVNELQQQLGLVNQVVTPINQAMQALLIRELTHYHTPELDALMAKLPPEGHLTIKEQERLAVLLAERENELNGSIPESEREAAHILPFVIKRVLAEAENIADAATAAPQLKIVAVPSDISQDDLQSPAEAVEGKKSDEQKQIKAG